MSLKFVIKDNKDYNYLSESGEFVCWIKDAILYDTKREAEEVISSISSSLDLRVTNELLTIEVTEEYLRLATRKQFTQEIK